MCAGGEQGKYFISNFDLSVHYSPVSDPQEKRLGKSKKNVNVQNIS